MQIRKITGRLLRKEADPDPAALFTFSLFALVVILAIIGALVIASNKTQRRAGSVQTPAKERVTVKPDLQPPNDPSLPSLSPSKGLQVRESNDGKKTLDLYKPIPDDFREVRAVEKATILTVSSPDNENFQTIVLKDSRGQYSLRLKGVELKPGQKIGEKQIIGYRHAVAHIAVRLIDSTGKPVDLRSQVPPMETAPENAYYPKH